VVGKLSRKAAPAEVRQFCSSALAIAFFRLPSLRATLLTAVLPDGESRHKHLREWDLSWSLHNAALRESAMAAAAAAAAAASPPLPVAPSPWLAPSSAAQKVEPGLTARERVGARGIGQRAPLNQPPPGPAADTEGRSAAVPSSAAPTSSGSMEGPVVPRGWSTDVTILAGPAHEALLAQSGEAAWVEPREVVDQWSALWAALPAPTEARDAREHEATLRLAEKAVAGK
jgi:hypothetical protein